MKITKYFHSINVILKLLETTLFFTYNKIEP